jgi:hypothetical protein
MMPSLVDGVMCMVWDVQDTRYILPHDTLPVVQRRERLLATNHILLLQGSILLMYCSAESRLTCRSEMLITCQ